MASISVTAPNTVTGNTVTIHFTSDVTLTNVELTKDGSNFITANSFTQTSAVFNVGSWANGTYSNCYLRGTYSSTSGGGSSNGGSSGGGSTGTTLTIVLGRCGFNSSGGLDSNTAYTHTETYIPFDGNTNKTLSWGSSGWTRYVFYDSGKKVIGTTTSDSAITSVKMSELKSLSPNAVYVRMSINITVSSITLT